MYIIDKEGVFVVIRLLVEVDECNYFHHLPARYKRGTMPLVPIQADMKHGGYSTTLLVPLDSRESG